jgi:hypothetical protein
MEKTNLIRREDVDHDLAVNAQLDEVTSVQANAAMKNRERHVPLKRDATNHELGDQPVEIAGTRTARAQPAQHELRAADHDGRKLLRLGVGGRCGLHPHPSAACAVELRDSRGSPTGS